MGKLVLTNNKAWSDVLRNDLEKAGFKKFAYIDSKEFLSVYKKLKVDTYNLYQNGQDYVACTGTMIYNEKIGQPALKSLFEDFNEVNLTKIRENICGCYALVIKKDSNIYILVDDYNTYSMYYYLDDTNYCISNNFYHVANVVKSPIIPLRAIEYVIQVDSVDNYSPYENIYRLMGDEYLHIDLEKEECCVNKFDVSQKHSNEMINDMDKALEVYKKALLYYAELRKNLFKQSAIFITGGVDSRLVLSSYMAVGDKPLLRRWQGGNGVMNSKVEDYIISKNIAKTFDLSFKNYNVGENYIKRVTQTDKKDYDKFGEYVFKYGNNEKWHKIFEDLKIDFLDCGHFGEILVTWDKFKNSCLDFSKKVTVKDFVTQLYIHYPNAIENWTHKDDFIEMLCSEITALADKQGIDCNNLTETDCMWFMFNKRLQSDTELSNIMNLYFYHFPILCQKQTAEIANNINYSLKDNHEFVLRLIGQVYPKLLECTFFSHCRYRCTDLENYRFKNPPKSMRFRKNLWTKIYLRIMGISKKRRLIEKEDAIIKDFCLKNLKPFLNELDYKLDKNSIGYMPRYSIFYLFGKMHEFITKNQLSL